MLIPYMQTRVITMLASISFGTLVISEFVPDPHDLGTALTTDQVSSCIHVMFSDGVCPATSTCMLPYTLLYLLEIFERDDLCRTRFIRCLDSGVSDDVIIS